VPEPIPSDDSSRVSTGRSRAERSADHAAIERLAVELLPALMAKLAATGLGELEVREGAWRVRLRRPGDGTFRRDRRAGDRERGERGSRGAAGGGSSTHAGHGPHAAHLAGLTPVGPGRDGRDGYDGRDGHDGHGGPRDTSRTVATSPAVGIFKPRPEARSGTKVRAGDRVGSVNVLGIPQEVLAPADGVVGASLVEAGDAVEYGQELIVIEFASGGAPAASNGHREA
jgi:biotin carboxyl carrier protein